VARTNAVNFSGALQFPMASAATDLFKKEDVQTLALAVDGHDHSAGKGLVLPASAIPPITSAMIQDNTIDTVDLKDAAVTTAKIYGNAVSQRAWYRQAAGNSTTSTTPVAISGAQLVFTMHGGDALVWFSLPLMNTAGANGAYVFVYVDGSLRETPIYINLPAGSGTQPVSAAILVTGLSAASHTFALYWQTTGGTLAQNAAAATIVLVQEMLR
jgi:hypothetical protein